MIPSAGLGKLLGGGSGDHFAKWQGLVVRALAISSDRVTAGAVGREEALSPGYKVRFVRQRCACNEDADRGNGAYLAKKSSLGELKPVPVAAS